MNEAITFVKDMSRDELYQAEARTMHDIVMMSKKPIAIQFEASNALEARLKNIQNRLTKMETK